MSEERFVRNIMFWGTECGDRLACSHVAVVGIGGVGSYAAECLARAGVGRLTLLDHDLISLSNINRQVIALTSTLGRPKAVAMAERVRDINPNIFAEARVARYEAESRERVLFDQPYNYIIDAIDLVSCKIDLIETAIVRNIPVISALGTGNKSDPTQFCITDIALTQGCPFARVIRRELRKRGILHHRVVYSPEPAIHPLQVELPPPGRRSVPASLPWVPSVAGLLLAAEVVNSLCVERREDLTASEPEEKNNENNGN